MPSGDYYIGAILTIDDADSSNNTRYDPTPITVTTSPTNSIEGRWTGSTTIYSGAESCAWNVVVTAVANTSTTGQVTLTSSLISDNSPTIQCISTYSEGNYSINGNSVRVQITYMSSGYAIGDLIHNFVLESSNRLIQNETELWEGVWITTTSTLVKD